jgi:Cu/Ag efflux protein CusF
MNPLKPAVILAAAFAAPASAQQPAPATDHTAHHVAQAKNDVALSEGEVRKVDKDAKKLTIRHGPLKNLDMPGMTMVFQVQDPAMLDRVKTGDKIRFNAEKAPSGFIVTEIETVK